MFLCNIRYALGEPAIEGLRAISQVVFFEACFWGRWPKELMATNPRLIHPDYRTISIRKVFGADELISKM